MHVLGEIDGQRRRLHQGTSAVVGEVPGFIGLPRARQVVLLQVAEDHVAVAQELLAAKLRVRELIDSGGRSETVDLSPSQER